MNAIWHTVHAVVMATVVLFIVVGSAWVVAVLLGAGVEVWSW